MVIVGLVIENGTHYLVGASGWGSNISLPVSGGTMELLWFCDRANILPHHGEGYSDVLA